MRDKVVVVGKSPGRFGSDLDERDNIDKSSSLNMTRQSDAKQRKKLYMHKPLVVDVLGGQAESSSMPTVKEQIDTLEAIKAYNKALKPARKAKDSLNEIMT